MGEKWQIVVIKTQSILVILLNISLLALIFWKRVLRNKYSNWFLANLFFAHVVEGCVGYMRCSLLYSEVRDAYKVKTAVNLFTLSTVFSYLTYVPVTLDRLFAVKWPFRYQLLKTNRVLAVIGIMWLITFVFAVTVFSLRMNSSYGDMITMSLTTVMFAILISANVLVYGIVRRQADKIKKTIVQRKSLDVAVVAFATATPTIPSMLPSSSAMVSASRINAEENELSLHEYEKSKKLFNVEFPTPNLNQYRTKEVFENIECQSAPVRRYSNKEHPPDHIQQEISTTSTTLTSSKHFKSNRRSRRRKVKKTTLLDRRCVRSAYICTGIVISFMLCWSPHALHDLLKTTRAAPSIFYSDSALARTTLIIAFCNGIIDPIIYVSMNKDIKRELQKITKRIFRNNIVHPMDI